MRTQIQLHFQPKQIQTEPGKPFQDINLVYPRSAMKAYCLPPTTSASDPKIEAGWIAKYTLVKAITYFTELCKRDTRQGECCACDTIRFRTHLFRGKTNAQVVYYNLYLDQLNFPIPCKTR